MKPVAQDPGDLERALTEGSLQCPGCGDGPLRRWGWATRRTIRTLDGDRQVRPRRARCAACGATHVLLPDWLVLRRADSAEVIAAALAAYPALGYRRVGRLVQRPRTTVRDWIRAAPAAPAPATNTSPPHPQPAGHPRPPPRDLPTTG